MMLFTHVKIHDKVTTKDVVSESEETKTKTFKINYEKLDQIKQILTKDLSNEAIQSFLKIFFSTHKVIKFFWLLCVLVSMGLCSYLVIQSILSYLSYGVSTSTKNVVENPTDFPKITFCK